MVSELYLNYCVCLYYNVRTVSKTFTNVVITISVSGQLAACDLGRELNSTLFILTCVQILMTARKRVT